MMDFEQIKKLWQDEDARIAVTGDLTETIDTVRNKKRRFERELVVSDIVEVGAGLFVAYIFAVVAPPTLKTPHVLLYAATAVILLLSGFFVGNRIYLLRLRSQRHDSVAEEIAYFLKILNWRICLMRNIVWWYLLPVLIAMAFVQVTCLVEVLPAWHRAPLLIVGVFGFTSLVIVLANVCVYRLNQRAVKKTLLPQKEMLEKVLKDLTASE